MVGGRASVPQTDNDLLRIRAAASLAAARWGTEVTRMQSQCDVLENWPAIRAAMPQRDPLFLLSLALTAGSDEPLNFGLLSRSNYSAGLDVTGPMSQFSQAFRRYAQNGAPRLFLNSMDNTVALEAMLPVKLGFSSDAAIARGIPAAAAATLLDPYSFQDTPNDTLEHIHWSAVLAQEQSLVHLLLGPAASPGALTDPQFYGRAQLQLLASDQPLTLFEYAPGLPRHQGPQPSSAAKARSITIPSADLPGRHALTRSWYLTHADGTVHLRVRPASAQDAEFRLQPLSSATMASIIRQALAANQVEARNMVANFSPQSDNPRAAMLFDCGPVSGGDSASAADHSGAGILDAYGLFDPRYLDYLDQIQLLDARRLDDAQFVNVYARQGLAAVFLASRRRYPLATPRLPRQCLQSYGPP